MVTHVGVELVVLSLVEHGVGVGKQVCNTVRILHQGNSLICSLFDDCKLLQSLFTLNWLRPST